MEQLLHTPEGVRDIYHEECAKSWHFRTDFIRLCICTDIMISRLLCMNILMYSEKRSEPFLQRELYKFF